MNLNLQEQHQVVKIINLLMEFKFVADELSKKNDVTISHSVPLFQQLLYILNNNQESDSSLIIEMKSHMKTKLKLENRYSKNQLEKLVTITYFDPRVKCLISSNLSPEHLKKNIKNSNISDVSPKQKILHTIYKDDKKVTPLIKN